MQGDSDTGSEHTDIESVEVMNGGTYESSETEGEKVDVEVGFKVMTLKIVEIVAEFKMVERMIQTLRVRNVMSGVEAGAEVAVDAEVDVEVRFKVMTRRIENIQKAGVMVEVDMAKDHGNT